MHYVHSRFCLPQEASCWLRRQYVTLRPPGLPLVYPQKKRVFSSRRRALQQAAAGCCKQTCPLEGLPASDQRQVRVLHNNGAHLAIDMIRLCKKRLIHFAGAGLCTDAWSRRKALRLL